jgi:hypothetical protein
LRSDDRLNREVDQDRQNYQTVLADVKNKMIITNMFSVLPSNVSDFHQSILVDSLIALKTNFYNDNFDSRRFKEEGQLLINLGTK